MYKFIFLTDLQIDILPMLLGFFSRCQVIEMNIIADPKEPLDDKSNDNGLLVPAKRANSAFRMNV